MEQAYTKREQDEWRTDVKHQLDRIEEQTIRTNGRVTKLEFWRGMMIGGLIIISSIILPLVFMIIPKLLK